MSRIEEELVRDIAAVTRGLVMTELDLERARDTIDDRVGEQRTGGRRRTLAAVLAAAVAVPVIGWTAARTWDATQGAEPVAPPASPAPYSSEDINEGFLRGADPTPDSLQGLWRVDNGTILVRFWGDDRVAFDNLGRMYSRPAVAGSYTITGDLVTITPGGGPAMCGGEPFAMRLTLPRAGHARVVHTRPGAGDCVAGINEWWHLEKVLPTTHSLTIFHPGREKGWRLPTTSELHGLWLAQGGGHVLEVDADGDYYVAGQDGDLVDQGRWSRSGGDLTLLSSRGSATCRIGNELRWSDVELFRGGTDFIRGTVERNECNADWTPEDWLLIPQEDS